MEEAQNQPIINKKRIKRVEIANIDEDRISSLPDCLLIEILTRLSSTKDAIRMGTLSKRWQYLWTSIPNLVFHDINRKQPLFHFYSFVDETLSKCRQSKLHKFELVTVYQTRFESQLNNWIRYAINCNVEDFTLIFWDSACEAEFLRHRFFYTSSCFTRLTLEGCIFNPSGQISWNNLKSLSIAHGKLDEYLIQNILCGSPLLETLNLDRCYGYRRIDITSKSVKNLVFCGYTSCRDNDLPNIIEINAPYILSLTFKYDLFAGKLLLLDMSSLVKANLDYMIKWHYSAMHKEAEEKMLKGFILKLLHVKELQIGSLCFKVMSRLEDKGFIFPSNLKFIYNDSLELCDWSDSDSA